MASSTPIRLPVNLNPYRRACDEGPRVVPIRAILSWNDVPACGNPELGAHVGQPRRDADPDPAGRADGHRRLSARSSTTSAARRSARSTRARDWPPSIGRSAARCASRARFPGHSISLGAANTLEYKVWATQGATTIPLVIAVPGDRRAGHRPRHRDQLRRSTRWLAPTTTSRTASTARRRSAHGGASPARTVCSRTGTREGLTGTWTIHIQARVDRHGGADLRRPASRRAWPTARRGSSVDVTLDQEAPVADVTITGYTDAIGIPRGAAVRRLHRRASRSTARSTSRTTWASVRTASRWSRAAR